MVFLDRIEDISDFLRYYQHDHSLRDSLRRMLLMMNLLLLEAELTVCQVSTPPAMVRESLNNDSLEKFFVQQTDRPTCL